MLTFTVSNIAEFLNAIEMSTEHFNNHMLWWRGQAQSDWELTASIYHQKKKKEEINMCIHFRSKAKVRYPNCPDNNDFIGWLLLMQHYGMPTRLLDWSSSPLIGLYFAVNDSNYINKDGALWGLESVSLNINQISLRGTPNHDHEVVKNIANGAFYSQEIENSEKSISIVTQHFDIRQLIQESEFTIHGIDTPLEKLKECDKYLTKIIIPQKAKENIKNSLYLLGISRSYIFPDINNLAKELTETKYDI